MQDGGGGDFEEVETDIDIIDKNNESGSVGEEIVSSVAVRVRR